MADDRINMTSDEFFDRWSEWCSMKVSRREAEVLNTVFVNIMTAFEDRGSPASARRILNGSGTIWASPDIRTNG